MFFVSVGVTWVDFRWWWLCWSVKVEEVKDVLWAVKGVVDDGNDICEEESKVVSLV